MQTITLPQFRALFGWVPEKAVDGKYADTDDRQILATLSAFAQPGRVCEFGVNEGRTAELLLRTGPWIRHYCGIDVFPGFQTTWDKQQAEVPAEGRAGFFAIADPRMHVVLTTEGIGPGIEQLTGHAFDLIFIDADHTFEGVSRDTQLAKLVAAPGCCLIWHDYTNDCPGVRRFLDQYSNACNRVLHVAGTRVAFQFLR